MVIKVCNKQGLFCLKSYDYTGVIRPPLLVWCTIFFLNNCVGRLGKKKTLYKRENCTLNENTSILGCTNFVVFSCVEPSHSAILDLLSHQSFFFFILK